MRKALVLRAFRGLPVCLSLFTCARSVRCGMEVLTSARVSNHGHQAAELGCGKLRRCPVIRPATNQRGRDTPYDRRRTLTAAYRGRELASPLMAVVPCHLNGFYKTALS